MSSAAASMPLIALAGSPNSGKTALFNALTGARQKVANYPGVTVERKEGKAFTPAGREVRILDLPGTYSLNPQTPDEVITREALFGSESPEAVVAVADTTNLERSLGLVIELRETGHPVILALNMMDLARKRGLRLDLKRLEEELRLPVVEMVAIKGQGVDQLLKTIDRQLSQFSASGESRGVAPSEPLDTRARFKEVDRILEEATLSKTRPDRWTDRLDSILLHPVLGNLILVACLTLIFQAVFTWAGPFQDAIEGFFGLLGGGIRAVIPPGALSDLLVDGVIAGVGGVAVFLPQIVLLFFFILLLEDMGYLSRAAFLMDRTMGTAGLHGRAFIPLLSSFACAIPGMMAARTIQSPRDRLSTLMVAPLMTCSARIPVYTLLIAAFIPNQVVLGPFRLQGMVLFGLYVLGVVSALVVAFFLKKTVLNGPKPPLLMELPTYKWPNARNIMTALWHRSSAFVKRAGSLILGLTILLWFLSSYPKPPAQHSEPAINYSYAGQMGRWVEPWVRPLGFDWKIGVALIPGFAAREVMVGALGTVYAVEADDDHLEQKLGERLVAGWSLATALSLLIWYVFAPQCLATLAVCRRETQSWKWPAFMMLYLTGLAYAMSALTFYLASHLGLGGLGGL